MLQSIKPNRPRVGAKWEVYCDGGTVATNPSSEGGWGFSVWSDGLLYHAAHGKIAGRITSGVAEFSAVSRAMHWCSVSLRGVQFIIYSDSKTVIDVCNCDSKLKDSELQRIYASITMSQNFVSPEFKRTDRRVEKQQFTDYLANLGNHASRQYSTEEQHTLLLSSFHSWQTYYETHETHETK